METPKIENTAAARDASGNVSAVVYRGKFKLVVFT